METTPPVARTLEEANALLTVRWVEVQYLGEQIAHLEARLGKDSSNSSRPPSSDPPSKPAAKPPQRQRSGRKPGGQPGHPGRQRRLVPVEQVDHIQEHWPEVCSPCGLELTADAADVVGEPVRHQVVELPPVRAEVTEHQLHRVCCQGATG